MCWFSVVFGVFFVIGVDYLSFICMVYCKIDFDWFKIIGLYMSENNIIYIMLKKYS